MSRDQILEAAAQIFRTKGYHAASMSDIAQAVNLQKASLYHHVSSKQDILLALLDLGLDMVTQELLAVLENDGAPEEKLRLAMTTYLQTLVKQRDLTAVLLLEYRSLEPMLLARHIPRRDRFEQIWSDLIQEGVDSGVFRCQNPRLAARALLGVMNWTITWFRPDGRLTASEVASQFANIFINGLLNREEDEDNRKRN